MKAPIKIKIFGAGYKIAPIKNAPYKIEKRAKPAYGGRAQPPARTRFKFYWAAHFIRAPRAMRKIFGA